MSASSLQVTPGSGLRLSTNSYTEGAVTVHDQKVILGEPYEATYVTSFDAVSVASAGQFVNLMAGASLPVYVRRIYLAQQGYTTTAVWQIRIYRLTTAATGGAAPGVSPLDTTDAAAGATVMQLPTGSGTEAALLHLRSMVFAATSTTALANPGGQVLDLSFPNQGRKSLRIPAGTANGITIKVQTAGGASNTASGFIEFVERSF